MVAYDNNDKKQESVYSQRIKAGKRRTYFFDVRETRSNDYYLTITESRKRFNEDGYDRHKVFLYKEDFNKFLKALSETIEHVKTELMPDFDFDAFNHAYEEGEYPASAPVTTTLADEAEPAPVQPPVKEIASATTSANLSTSSATIADNSITDEQAEKW